MLRSYRKDDAPATRGTVYALGDSLEYGTLSGDGIGGAVPDGPGWPTRLGYTNLGVPGATWGPYSGAGDIYAEYGSVPLNAGTVILGGQVNNLGKLETGERIFRRILLAEAQAWRKGAKNVLVKVVTPFGSTVFGASPTDLATINANRLDLNTLIRETYRQRGQLIDVVSVVGGDLLSSTYNVGDGVHLNTAGQVAFAAAVGPVVTALTL